MPTPPNIRPNPLTPQYLWNEATHNYINRATGRFVKRQIVRGQLDKVIDASSQVMRAVTQQFRAGEISMAEWQTAMMQQIKTTHLAGAAMQRGGWQQMTQSDFGRVGRIVRDEYGHLRDLSDLIVSGKQKLDGTLVRRVALYGQEGRPTFYTFWDLTATQRGFDQERSILNPADHCDDCVSQDAKGFQARGKMIPIGRRQCRSNDRCDVEFRNSQTGETLRV